MGFAPGRQAVQLRIQRDVVDALEGCPALRTEGGRQLLVDVLSDVFAGTVFLRSQFAGRVQLVDLVRHCCALPGGLQSLADGVAVLEPEAVTLPILRLCADEWEALSAVPIEDWHDLRAALLLVRLATDEHAERVRLRALLRLCTESRMDELPDHCRSVWETFLHLAGVNSAPASLPPALIFLGRVADEIRDLGLGAELRNRVRRWSDSLGVRSPEARQAEPWRDLGEVVVSVDVDLVIQFDPDPTDRDRFLVSHWRNWGARGRHSARRGDTIVGRADLEREVDRLISELEVELGSSPEASDTGQIFLVFVVPWEMLNVPVEFWRKASMSEDAVPLAVDHPVVLSSLERMRAVRHRLAWKQRWRSLSSSPSACRAYWSRPSGGEYFTRLAADLSDDHQIASLVLSEPPADLASTAWREMAMAFRAGIPAIIWDREDCADDGFRAAIAAVHADGEEIAGLPRRIAALRREALRVHPDQRHAGRSLAVLWDDPDRLPESVSAW